MTTPRYTELADLLATRLQPDYITVTETIAALRHAADLERENVAVRHDRNTMVVERGRFLRERDEARAEVAELRERLVVAEQLADDFPVGDLLTTRAHGLNQWMRRLIFFRSARPVTDQTGAPSS